MANFTGSTPHALMQWNNIAASNMHGDTITPPEVGTIPPEVMNPLRNVLLRHSTPDSNCFLGAAFEWGHDYQEGVPIPTTRINTGARAWDLFHAPVSMMDTKLFADEDQTVNMIWCCDASWWVTTDIDLVTTYIGGSDALIQDILDSSALESWPVAMDDDTTFGADTVNPVRGWFIG